MLINLLKPILNLAIDYGRNRLLNVHSVKGASLILAVGAGLGYLDKDKVALVMSILHGANFTYLDFWILLFNLVGVYLVFLGCFWIFIKATHYDINKK